jgi:hypothetical protein
MHQFRRTAGHALAKCLWAMPMIGRGPRHPGNQARDGDGRLKRAQALHHIGREGGDGTIHEVDVLDDRATGEGVMVPNRPLNASSRWGILARKRDLAIWAKTVRSRSPSIIACDDRLQTVDATEDNLIPASR